MVELFADLPEALANSVEIARRCNLQLELGKNVLPDFPVPEGMTAAGYFSDPGRRRAGAATTETVRNPLASDFTARRARI